MIRILYTTPFSDVIGGGQVGLLLLLERLDRKRFKPLLLVPQEGEVAVRARKLGCDVEIFPFPPVRSLHKVLPEILRFRRLLKSRQISLIHTDDPRSTLYSVIARMGLGVPVVWHIRTMLGDPLDPLLERSVDRIILVAGSLASRFSKRGRGKSVVIHNGIDVSDVAVVDKGSLPVGGSPLILCPARMHEPKGQHVLLQALKPLKKEFPSLGLWLVGRGEDEYISRLKRDAKEYGLESALQILGYRPDLRALFPFVDLVVLPTFHEAFPRVLLEAMAASRAVVASDVGGVPEAVLNGKTGILVPAGDAGKLTEAIAELLRDPEKRKRMGDAGRQAVDSFSMESMVGSIEKIYEEF